MIKHARVYHDMGKSQHSENAQASSISFHQMFFRNDKTSMCISTII